MTAIGLTKFVLLGVIAISGCKQTIQPRPFENLGANPSPTTTRTTLFSSDDIGETFRSYFGQAADGETASDESAASYGVVTIKIVDASTFVVSTKSGNKLTYKFSSNLSGASGGNETMDWFTEGNGGLGSLLVAKYFAGSRYGFSFTPYESSSSLGVTNWFQFGHVTKPKNLSGTATYSSTDFSDMFLAGGGNRRFFSYRGNADLTANFNRGTISGTLFDNTSAGDLHSIKVRIVDADITGSEFVGTSRISVTTTADSSFGVSGQSGDVAGQFVGGTGSVVQGAFGGDLTTSSSIGSAQWTYSGTFQGF